MSTTLDTIFTLQNWHTAIEPGDLPLRGHGHGHSHGGSGGSRHFFFWGGGSGGSLLLVPFIAIGAFFAYLWRNPDKASNLKDRLRGALGAVSGRLQPSGPALRFNPPPGWPTPPRDWRPPADWAPDPSWPAAPADWQFWVPDDTGPHYSNGYAA